MRRKAGEREKRAGEMVDERRGRDEQKVEDAGTFVA